MARGGQEADIGVAGGKDMGIIFKKGKSDRLSAKGDKQYLNILKRTSKHYLKKIQRQNEFL